MKTSLRSQKLASVIEQKLGYLIQKNFSPNEIGFVTITGVEVAGDLGVADIFVTSIGGSPDFVEQLNKGSKKISHCLLQEIELRRNIILRFKIDKSGELLAKLKETIENSSAKNNKL